MPPLEKPTEIKKIPLEPRQAIMAAQTDVLVVGGGPAGIGAAVGAADAGAKVILAERYGFFGGNATAALVTPLMSSYTYSKPVYKRDSMSLLPIDIGAGRKIIGGVFDQFIKKLIEDGGAVPPSIETGYVIPFDPEIMKLTALEILDSAKVSYLFHTYAEEVISRNENREVVFATKSGSVVISARVVIDCTGDGDIAVSAGADYEIGRNEDGRVQPMTLMFRMGEFDKHGFENYVRKNPGQWKGVYGLWDLIKEATEAGDLELQRENILFFKTPHEKELSVNCTRILNVLGTDVWDWSRAEYQGRKQIHQIADFLKKYVPGFEKSYVIQSGVHTGVRESRRIVGEYKLTTDDILSVRKFDDMIACGSYPIDIHNPKGSGTTLVHLPVNQWYTIPLRCLIPKKIDQVLLAGRCISGTHEAHSSYRIMPISFATGHAAGVCAALSVRAGKLTRDIPAIDVQNELLKQGAILDR
ncbi:MAG: FAD-dependent oxidoreductase [Planctomycetes bacterium GWF2_41_51]|nr:MAG: FAD-dependent oxidoreductase [Planctomycetes bacterium GWF2_41_51]